MVQLQIDPIAEDKAKKILERVDLIKIIRDDLLDHPKLDERMILCEPASDLPDWWISGKHDKDLLQGVARHGMARMDYYVLNDPELSFKDILKRHLCGEALLDNKAANEYEKAREKAKSSPAKDKKSDETTEKDKKDDDGEGQGEDDEDADMEKTNDKKVDEKAEQIIEENAEKADKSAADKEDSAKPPVTRSRKASVSISPPQITLQQMEQMAKGGLMYDMDMMNDLMAQTYAAAVKWPKDQILAIRLDQIVKCVNEGTWPVKSGYSLGEHLAELQDSECSPFDSKSPDANLRETSTPLSESSDVSGLDEVGRNKKQQRRKEPEVAENQSSKIRQLLTTGLIAKESDINEEDPIAR
jgi:hypothetical protein